MAIALARRFYDYFSADQLYRKLVCITCIDLELRPEHGRGKITRIHRKRPGRILVYGKTRSSRASGRPAALR